MADNNYQSSPPKRIRKKGVLDISALTITGPKLDGARRPATLKMFMNGYSPTIVVNYNNDQEKDFVQAKMTKPAFDVFLTVMEIAAIGENHPKAAAFPNLNKGVRIGCKSDWDMGKKLDKKEVVSSVVVGIEPDSGVIFLAVLKKDFEPVKFHLTSDWAYTIKTLAGERVDDSELSRARALSIAQNFRQLANLNMNGNYEPPEPRNNGGKGGRGYNGGGGGGQQNQSQGSGNKNWNNNSSKQSNDNMFDDDIPL